MNKAQLLAFYQVGIKRIEMIQENEFRLINQNDDEVHIVITEVLTKAGLIAKLQTELEAKNAEIAALQSELSTLQ